MTRRVFFYVQHLLGIGHLKRAATLVDAMTRAGLEVTLVSGGLPVPGLNINAARVVQLPPASTADASFKQLLDASGRPIDEAWKARRREALLGAWNEARPHAMVVELYPFGRRQMRFELDPLLVAASTASPRPVIVSSVRDVLGGSGDPARQAMQLEVFNRYFDHLLVHGDPALIPFERTFGPAAQLGASLHYTGYVVNMPSMAARDELVNSAGFAGTNEVLVSAGGGAVGAGLLSAAIRARPLTRAAGLTWRILAGVNMPAAEFSALQVLSRDTGEGRVILERSRDDFTQLLGRCAVSVSQGGYNTLMETLQARARTVVVPFAAGNETEQTLRVELLQQRGVLEWVRESELTPQVLAAAIDRAMLKERPQRVPVDLDGASKSAQWLVEWTQTVGKRVSDTGSGAVN